MNWLVTGGCGFIGVNLVKRLLSENQEVTIIDNLKTSKQNLKYLKGINPSKVWYHDIKNEDLAINLCEGIDIIVHLAANTGVPVSVENPKVDCINNVVGTLNYLEAARIQGVKKFIFASSSAVPGNHEPPYNERLFPRPLSPYGASKASSEGYCHAYNKSYGINTVSLRFSNVYGSYSKGKKVQLIPKFIMSSMKGETLEIYGDGSQTRDFCYVDDLIDVIMVCSENDNIGGHVFQIATGVETSVQFITDNIVDLLSKRGIGNIKVKYGNERVGDVKRNYSDISKAESLLGWKSKIDIKEGLYKTVEWFYNSRSLDEERNSLWW